MATRTLILASNSKYKRQQMNHLGMTFSARGPLCIEMKKEGETPRQQVKRLAREKAQSLANDFDDALIVGADQGVEFQGELLGKPSTVEKAIEQLEKLSGREHFLLTALAVIDTKTKKTHQEMDICRLHVRRLSKKNIQWYVAKENPLDCAGSYKFESLGVTLFERVEAQDPTAIIGLPLIRLCRLLESAGVHFFDQGTG